MVNLDSQSYRTKYSEEGLLALKVAKKKKQLANFQQVNHDFTPFVASRNTLLGPEANSLIK